ncbi:MAG: DUF4191 domain-containing protein [Candidatus Ancillula sp.]|jgi:hypothetical protein|nr:DUF4191 domain-containing protein [Candidatus Ancillula sp.]
MKKERFKNIRNLIEVYKVTADVKPRFKLYSLLALVLPLVISILLAVFTGWYFVFVPLAIFGPAIAFLMTLSRNAESAGYQRLDGQPGASGAVLNNMKFTSTLFEEEPVAVDPKTYDLIFRGTGRAGVFLVTEGPTSRVKKLLDKEVKKTNRILPKVPITIINSGNDQGQVPLKGLRKAITKPKVTLSKQEVLVIRNRLKSLGGMKLPIPKGMDPNRAPKGVSRRALRG